MLGLIGEEDTGVICIGDCLNSRRVGKSKLGSVFVAPDCSPGIGSVNCASAFGIMLGFVD